MRLRNQYVIMLDIDGVLATCCTLPGYHLDGTRVNLLLTLCDDWRAKLVISSSWRLPDYASFLGRLRLGDWEIGKKLLPYLHPDWCTPRLPDKGKIRGDEVDMWLRRQHVRYEYVCIDDDGDFHPHQFLVQTFGYSGFGLEDCYLCDTYFRSREIRTDQQESMWPPIWTEDMHILSAQQRNLRDMYEYRRKLSEKILGQLALFRQTPIGTPDQWREPYQRQTDPTEQYT